MGKQKRIGKDVISKTGAIISTPKDHEEFEEWKEEQRQEKKAKKAEEVEGKKIQYVLPEEQPTDEELEKAKAKEMEEMAKAKAQGKLKDVHVNEHHRSHPKRSGEKPKSKKKQGFEEIF